MRKIIFILLFVWVATASAEETTVAKVLLVEDGDTVLFSSISGVKVFTCRLYGIDAPEIIHRAYNKPGQPYGREARDVLKGLILNRLVTVTLTGKDSYSREICLLRAYVNGQSTDINLEMVKRGYAWAYRQYLRRPYASEYIEAERAARAAGLGLWQDSNPKAPWEFRHEGGVQ